MFNLLYFASYCTALHCIFVLHCYDKVEIGRQRTVFLVPTFVGCRSGCFTPSPSEWEMKVIPTLWCPPYLVTGGDLRSHGPHQAENKKLYKTQNREVWVRTIKVHLALPACLTFLSESWLVITLIEGDWLGRKFLYLAIYIYYCFGLRPPIDPFG